MLAQAAMAAQAPRPAGMVAPAGGIPGMPQPPPPQHFGVFGAMPGFTGQQAAQRMGAQQMIPGLMPGLMPGQPGGPPATPPPPPAGTPPAPVGSPPAPGYAKSSAQPGSGAPA